MLLTKKQGVDDIIAENLAKNPYSTGPQLVALVQKSREYTTKQAVYTALKQLTESEAVAKVGHTYFLSRVWLSKLDELFRVQKEKELVRDAIFDLQDKESIYYHFPNLLTCDTYWAHVFDLLLEWIPSDRPICGWMPHEWFAVGRQDVERNIFNEHIARKKYMFYTVGGTTPLDMEFKREWQNPYVVVHTTNAAPFTKTYHLHIFDDFLIEVFIKEDLAQEIEQFYAQHKTLGVENVVFFEALINKKSPVRMKISRKKKKAAQLRKQLTKHFHIPAPLHI